MSIELEGVEVGSVVVVDDQWESRQAFEYTIEDAELEPYLEEGPIESVKEYAKKVQQNGDALLCDFHLSKHKYAPFNGDQLVAECYNLKIPVILCTSYTDWELRILRKNRQFIPIVMRPNDLDVATLKQGLEVCIREFHGDFTVFRKSHRTLVRVDDVDADQRIFHAILPGWDSSQKIRLDMEDVPDNIQELIEPDKRFHASVNIGANNHSELYFADWEED